MSEHDKKITVVTTNRKAFHQYEIIEKFEAGISLEGAEVKSVRAGKVQMSDSYAIVDEGEVFLLKLHISDYKMANYIGYDPIRRRRLLLNNHEIKKLWKAVNEKGFTIVPLRVYFSGAYAKVEIGIARGKKQYDKRQSIAKRDAERDMARKMRERQK